MATLLILIMTHALPQLLSTVPNSHFPELFKVLIIQVITAVLTVFLLFNDLNRRIK